MKTFLIMALVTIFMILVIDSMELIKRMGGRSILSVSDLLTITLTKLPYIVQESFVFLIFFTAIFTFFFLNKSGEYVAIKSIGVSTNKLLFPIVSVCIFMGIILIAVMNPIASNLLNYSELLEKKIMGKDTSSCISILGGEVWLVDDKDKDESYIITASKLKINGDSAELINPKFLFFDKNYIFKKSIQSNLATLEGQYWILKEYTEYLPREMPQSISSTHKVRNHLDIITLQNHFKDPTGISIWYLPSFISALESTSYPTGKYYVHLYKLLVKPLLMPAIVFLAAAFMLKHSRTYRTGPLLAVCISVFIVLYCFMEMLLNVQFQNKILHVLNFAAIVFILNWIGVSLVKFSELR